MFTSLTTRFSRNVLRSFFKYLVGLTQTEKAHLEVERKFRLDASEVTAIRSRLEALTYEHIGDVFMTDTFLPSPTPGEMMRIRQETLNGVTTVMLTHKTWIVTADGDKERQESERETRPFLASLLVVLGRMVSGEQLSGFSKERSLYRGQIDSGEVIVSIDNVSGLGDYSGFYVEIEIIVPAGTDPGAAKSAVYEVATKVFGEAREDVRQSYQDMLAASKAAK